MALQVWITGIDGMKNLGLGGTRNLGSSTSNANGKIGTCQKIITNYNSNCTLNPNTTDITMCGWFKFNLAELQTTLNNSGYNSSKTTPTGNLLGQHNYGGLALCYSTNNQYNASGTINAISVFGAFRDSNSLSSCSSLNIPFDTWTHIVLTWNHTTKTLTLYINGVSKATSTNAAITNITTWNFQINTGYVWVGNGPGKSIPLYFNDIRCYDNLLSEDEIHELSLGKVAHYLMNEDLPNLFLNSEFHLSSSDLAVTSSTTDWTKYVRYYNGSPSLHSFANGEDTINLGSSGNIGISFLRKATDINLDTSSLYTISCEAKCSKPNATLDIGLSYYNSSNSWVWRGGTNPQAFTATNTWQKFTLTFTPDADTQYISYCFTVIGASGHTFTLRKCKLEKGTIASKWIPAGDSKIHDISGLHNDLTNSGIIAFTIGSPRYNRCLQFNGTNYLSCTSPTAEAKTLSLWAYIGSIPTSSSVLFADYKSKLSIGFYNSGTLIITRCAGTSATLGTISSLVKTNSWNHFCVVNGATNQLYINGLAATMSGSDNWTHNTDVLMIGNRDYNNGSGFANKISDVRLYATALSADDVLKLYKLGNV